MKLTVVGALLSLAGAVQLHATEAKPFPAIHEGQPQVHMHLLNKAGAKSGEEHVTPPVSTTMKCVINLTIQYFVVYTALAVVRTYNELNNSAPMTTAPKILEAACTTVNYAPMLSVLFLGTRMRALQLSGGNPDAYDLPQPWVKNAMQCCAWSVLVQTVMVVAVPIVLGGEPKVDKDGTPIVEGSGMMGKALTAIKYLAMLGMYGGFTTVCVGAFLMEPVKALFPAGPPPVSPAVQCTMNLSTQYFAVYLAIAIIKTFHDFNPKTELPNPTMMAILMAMRYMVMLAIYGGFTAVIYSVMVIEAPPGRTYVPVSPAMQCTMNLTTQFFFVYLMLWVLVTVKQFAPPSEFGDSFLNIAIPTMDSARATVQFCPMLSILFIGVRMRALQIRPASEGGAPQGWAQEGMFLCTYSLLIQVLMVMILPLFTRGAPEMDEDGNPKVKSSGLAAYLLVAIRYTCFLALYGGVVTLIYSLNTIEYATADGSGKVLGIDPPPAPPTPPSPA